MKCVLILVFNILTLSQVKNQSKISCTMKCVLLLVFNILTLSQGEPQPDPDTHIHVHLDHEQEGSKGGLT